MRLLKPDPGEVADRMSILELKIHYGSAKGKDTSSWREEQIALDQYLLDRFPHADRRGYERLGKHLYEVNHNLWKLEDEIRVLMKKEVIDRWDQNRTLEIAFAVPRTNDARMDLVTQINQLFGIQRQEKLY